MIVTLPLMNTLPLISKSAPASSANVILPAKVIPSTPSRVTAEISSASPIAPILIVSVVLPSESVAPPAVLALIVRLLSPLATP